MTEVHYRLVEHDGGWAYEWDGVFSETFPTKEAAADAAKRASSEQEMPGETTDIEFQDESGRWKTELSRGDDRPETDVAE